MVKERYQCEKCGGDFDDRAKAERHEETPGTTLPEGFIYFTKSHLGNGQIIGDKVGTDGMHDVRYTIHALWNIDHEWVNPTIGLHSLNGYASEVRSRLGSGFYRHATEDDIRRVLSREGIVDALIRERLTELTLDLEGERTFPLVYAGESAPTYWVVNTK